MIARTTISGVIPGTRMSAAQPNLCWLLSLLPTESFTALLRKAEFTMIGLPSSLAFTNSRNCASRVKLAVSAALGVLSNCRWLVIVSSSSVKWGVRFTAFPLPSQPSCRSCLGSTCWCRRKNSGWLPRLCPAGNQGWCLQSGCLVPGWWRR